MSDDILLQTIVELKELLDKYEIPLIIGGGMGIYLRRLCLIEDRQTKYDKIVDLRTTSDVDIFLSADLIINSKKILFIRDAIGDLGYNPVVKYFQFSKEKEYNGIKKEVKIDLLACPPSIENLNKVKIKECRIRPKDISNIHAYLTEEAKGLAKGLIMINLKELFPGRKIKSNNLFVPSRFNYIILKLNAFNDRKDDIKSDYGRHHAYDIFACVTDMTEEDWRNAKEHFANDKNESYMTKTIEIQKNLFSTDENLGIIRIKENVSYKNNIKHFDKYIPEFINDLKELFK
jgi:hypothetical protein